MKKDKKIITLSIWTLILSISFIVAIQSNNLTQKINDFNQVIIFGIGFVLVLIVFILVYLFIKELMNKMGR